jgi:hypothetical protein
MSLPQITSPLPTIQLLICLPNLKSGGDDGPIDEQDAGRLKLGLFAGNSPKAGIGNEFSRASKWTGKVDGTKEISFTLSRNLVLLLLRQFLVNSNSTAACSIF